MILIKKLFPKIFTKDKIMLGRWNINYSKNYLDRKIYLANHDNCGPCGKVINIPKLNYKNKID